VKKFFTKNIIIFILFICVTLYYCEFKLPPEPSLPSSWEIRALFPFYENSYNLKELLKDDDIIADTSGILHYSKIIPATVSDFPDSFWIMNTYGIIEGFSTDQAVQIEDGSYAIMRRIPIYFDTSKVFIKEGILSNNSDFNHIMIHFTSSNPAPETLFIAVFSSNIHNVDRNETLANMAIPPGTTEDSMFVDLRNDTVFNVVDADTVNSLLLEIVLNFRSVELINNSYNFSLSIQPLPLEFNQLTGRVISSTEVSSISFENNPETSDTIDFSDCILALHLSGNFNQFDLMRLNLFTVEHGERNHFYTKLFTPSSVITLDSLGVINTFPDSIVMELLCYSKLNTYYSTSSLITPNINAELVIDIPFKILLTDTIRIIGGKATEFYIEDSTTKRKLQKCQKGASLEADVFNNTPLEGIVGFIHTNYNFTVYDSINFDSLLAIDSIFIDTVGSIMFDSTGGKQSDYYINYEKTSRLLSDGEHFLIPFFEFYPGGDSILTLKQDQNIIIKSYIRFYFDPDSLVE